MRVVLIINNKGRFLLASHEEVPENSIFEVLNILHSQIFLHKTFHISYLYQVSLGVGSYLLRSEVELKWQALSIKKLNVGVFSCTNLTPGAP